MKKGLMLVLFILLTGWIAVKFLKHSGSVSSYSSSSVEYEEYIDISKSVKLYIRFGNHLIDPVNLTNAYNLYDCILGGKSYLYYYDDSLNYTLKKDYVTCNSSVIDSLDISGSPFHFVDVLFVGNYTLTGTLGFIRLREFYRYPPIQIGNDYINITIFGNLNNTYAYTINTSAGDLFHRYYSVSPENIDIYKLLVYANIRLEKNKYKAVVLIDYDFPQPVKIDELGDNITIYIIQYKTQKMLNITGLHLLFDNIVFGLNISNITGFPRGTIAITKESAQAFPVYGYKFFLGKECDKLVNGTYSPAIKQLANNHTVYNNSWIIDYFIGGYYPGLYRCSMITVPVIYIKGYLGDLGVVRGVYYYTLLTINKSVYIRSLDDSLYVVLRFLKGGGQ